METSKGSRLPKPSGLKPPQIRIPKPLSENKVNRMPINSIVTTTKSASLRRSKSVADLRTMMNTRLLPKINKVQISKTAAPSTASKIAPKRKAEKSSTEEVKSKVVKHAKIPDWDYKSRYNLLREKHSVLNEEYKKQSLKVEELEDIESKYNEIKQQHEALEKKYVSLSNTHSALTNENKHLQSIKSEVEIKLCSVTKQHEELLKKYEDLLVKEKLVSDKFENLNKENNLVNNFLKDIKKDHTELKEEHEILVKAYSVLEKAFEQNLSENKSISTNLDIQTKLTKNLSQQILHLKKDLLQGESLRRKLHNTVQDLKGNIRVFCRVRPPINSEEEENLQCLLNYVDERTIEIRKSRESVSAISGKPTDIKAEFTLDRVFDPNSTQAEIFEDLSQLVQSALDGYDICVFAYGQTGSGKTYTMQGVENPDQMGLIPRTVDLIFNSIDNLSRAGWAYEVKASFLEIYNENVRDLLNPNPSQNLEIRYNEGKGTTVTNLHIQSISSAEELKKWMNIAQRNRAVAATDFNEHSSRSHAVTKIYLHGVNEEANTIYTGSINLVDLAGSESAKTSANERLQETKNINKSLSTLGSVMLALYNKEKHIPYRNSKLTYLLQSCLGGNSKTLMVVNIAPFEECYPESINSLRFAAKVKEVKMCVKRNKSNFLPPSANGKP